MPLNVAESRAVASGRRDLPADDQPPALPTRRTLLSGAAAFAVLSALGIAPSAAAAAGLRLGSGEPFSVDLLRARARQMAGEPYGPALAPNRDILQKIDYDALGRIHFDPRAALFGHGPGQFPLTFFHQGRLSPSAVRMHVVEPGGATATAREIVYDPRYFAMPADSPARQLVQGAGFAGFRVQESRAGGPAAPNWQTNDWVAFLGASYFRAIGSLHQYGLSARGIAIDVGQGGRPEEFPEFTAYYFEPSGANQATLAVHALLDGPSITGAYRFLLTRATGVLMDIEAVLFPRRDIECLGIAPLSSMYWFSGADKPGGVDWRAGVHDSDGLAIWNGAGKRIWRPLSNPQRTATSAFEDSNPRGFGLLQRDRNFDHYLDGVRYDRRPSVWVEPLDGWGEGSVQLVEIPTTDEVQDNIVAMWVPRARARAGASLRVHYRLHWLADEPYPSALARCVSTRSGRAPSFSDPPAPPVVATTRYVVEFRGGPLDILPAGRVPEAVLWSSRGQLSPAVTEAVPDGSAGHWRVRFDLTLAAAEVAELRLCLRDAGKMVSETWMFRHHPVIP